MTATIDRRALLAGAAGAALHLALPPVAIAARAPKPRAEVQDLGNGLYVIHGLGANVLAATTTDAVLLVDTAPEAARDALKSQLGKLPGRGRVRTVVNTHWHREQTGGNEMFGKAGAAIVAHVKTRQRLSVDLWQPATETWLKPLPQAAWPTRTFHEKETVAFADGDVELGYLLEAHTDGDLHAWFPEANVLAVGDVVTAPDRDPLLDWYGGGWLGGRIDSLDLLLKIATDRTRVVPAQGPVVGRKELQAERDLFNGLYDKLTVMMRKGFTDKDMLASNVMDTTGRAWRDPAGFLYAAQKGLWAHHNTISHDIV